MKNDLFAIIPSVRSSKLENTILSIQNQSGFNNIYIIVSGLVSRDRVFVNKIKKKYKNVFFAKTPSKSKLILPPKARNLGLKALKKIIKKNGRKKWVLFIDDDVIIPANYCQLLADFIKKNKILIAAMGNMKSAPKSFFGDIIDYSNFWWLQLNKNNLERGWICTAAVLTEYKYIKNFSFNEKYMYVGEDVDFFNRIANKYSKTLGILTETQCLHFHNRTNLFSFLKYQFNNGYFNFDWYYNPSKNFLFQFWNRLITTFRMPLRENYFFYKSRPFLKIFVFISFFVCELGVLYGSLQNKHRQKNNK